MTDFIINQIQAQSGLGLLCLVAVFFYIGLITIGGGQVGITIMQQVLVDQMHFGARLIILPWDTDEMYGHADGIVRF
ncbi:MAG: hypothetical protein II684_03835, partial [Treponema sp.]|nr:hypothetical protein [Treponema sp.]